MTLGIVMRNLGIVISGAFLAAAAPVAEAGDFEKYDHKVERAAAERAAAKIGDLRGGAVHDADLATLIEMKRKKLPRPQKAADENALPPMVSIDPPEGVDVIITGSNVRKN
jgi:hypothetical protein